LLQDQSLDVEGDRISDYNGFWPTRPEYMPVPLFDHARKEAEFLKLHAQVLVEAQNSYELVAISRGRPFFTPEYKSPRKITKQSEYYNVLWVEWIDGITYRRGFGRVFKHIWEEQKLEDVHLILG
jgi:hypothetical protein